MSNLLVLPILLFNSLGFLLVLTILLIENFVFLLATKLSFYKLQYLVFY